jgi:ATP-dependent Clp protease ATP-binding subunit ClpA
MFFDHIPMTDKARSIIIDTGLTAMQCNDTVVATEHLLLTLAADEATVAHILLASRGLTHDSINAALLEYRAQQGRLVLSDDVLPGESWYHPTLKKAIDLAWNEATYFDGPREQVGVVATEHLLIGLALEAGGFAGYHLSQQRADYVNLRRALRKLGAEEVALA